MDRRAHPLLAPALALALVAALSGLFWGAQPAAAQPAPGPTPTPRAAAAAADPGGFVATPAPQLPVGGFLSDPTAWASTVFQAALTTLMRSTSSDIVAVMGGLLGSGNVISQTPAKLSYENDAVKKLWHGSRAVANSLLAVLAVWGGFNLIVYPHIRAPYHTAMELLPRLVLGALLVNTSWSWGSFVISVNNALCQSFGTIALPAWDLLGSGLMDSVVALIAVLVYLVMGLLLLVQMMMRLALVDVLLVLAPLALLCWVLPQTHGWAQLWFGLFFGTVFTQSVQVVVLQLGTLLITQVSQIASPSMVADPETGRTALFGLILGIAVLHLTQRVPRLMLGSLGGVTTLSAAGFTGQARAVAAGQQAVRLASALRGGIGAR